MKKFLLIFISILNSIFLSGQNLTSNEILNLIGKKSPQSIISVLQNKGYVLYEKKTNQDVFVLSYGYGGWSEKDGDGMSWNWETGNNASCVYLRLYNNEKIKQVSFFTSNYSTFRQLKQSLSSRGFKLQKEDFSQDNYNSYLYLNSTKKIIIELSEAIGNKWYLTYWFND